MRNALRLKQCNAPNGSAVHRTWSMIGQCWEICRRQRKGFEFLLDVLAAIGQTAAILQRLRKVSFRFGHGPPAIVLSQTGGGGVLAGGCCRSSQRRRSSCSGGSIGGRIHADIEEAMKLARVMR